MSERATRRSRSKSIALAIAAAELRASRPQHVHLRLLEGLAAEPYHREDAEEARPQTDGHVQRRVRAVVALYRARPGGGRDEAGLGLRLAQVLADPHHRDQPPGPGLDRAEERVVGPGHPERVSNHLALDVAGLERRGGVLGRSLEQRFVAGARGLGRQ